MAGSAQANSRVCFAVSFFRLDHSFRGGEFFKGGRLPQAHGPFARARQIVAVRRKSEARNRALVPVKRGRFLHGSEIPQLDRAVVGAGGQRPAISRKGHIPEIAIVASQEPDISPVRLPKPDGDVRTGADNPFPIRGESDALNPSFVSFEHGLWARAMRMPERHFSFLASDYECPAVWCEGCADGHKGSFAPDRARSERSLNSRWIIAPDDLALPGEHRKATILGKDEPIRGLLFEQPQRGHLKPPRAPGAGHANGFPIG